MRPSPPPFSWSRAPNAKALPAPRPRTGARARGAGPEAGQETRRQAQHSRHLGRRHRLLERQRLQPRADGVPYPQHRPDRARGRTLHRPLWAAELHRRPRRIPDRAESLPYRPPQGGAPRCQGRVAARGSDAGRTPQAAGLRDRAVRQESPRRPRRHAPHHARLRRVLRLALPLERRGRAGRPRLSEGSRLPRQVRAPRRAAHLGAAERRPADREHRAAHQEADGDDRRRVRGGGQVVHHEVGQG